MPGKHGPNRLANYIAVHEASMARLAAEGFVLEDQCTFRFLPGVILLQGTVVCLDDITLEVEKQIAILGGRGMTARVQTSRFRYHAWIRGAYNILRYESAHEHRAFPHKHVYNTFGDGRESAVTDILNADDIPTLGEVLRELQDWHQDNAARIRALA